MTKAEIVEQIYEQVGFSKKESAELVEKVFDIIKETLAEGEKVKISGFGNFVVREKNARKGRNPKPRMLLLDEPAAGMNLEEVMDLDERIRKLRDSGVTILLVEHVMELVMGVADRIAVLNFGQKIAEGSPVEIQNDPVVQEAYLGVSEDAA